MKARTAMAIVAIAACAGSVAKADDIFTTGLYTVINYSGAYPDYKKLRGVYTPSFLDGVEADIGWRFNRFYSVEASYSYFTGSKTFGGATYDDTLQTGSVDGLGYLPFGYESPWALYGDVGATVYFAGAHMNTQSNANETRFGGRAGGGLQYQFDEDLGLRLSARYEWADFTNMRTAEVFAIGLVWQQ